MKVECLPPISSLLGIEPRALNSYVSTVHWGPSSALFAFYYYDYVLRRGLMHPTLTSNSLNRQGWLYIPDPPASASRGLGWQVCTTSFYGVLEIEHRVSCMRSRNSTNWATYPALSPTLESRLTASVLNLLKPLLGLYTLRCRAHSKKCGGPKRQIQV